MIKDVLAGAKFLSELFGAHRKTKTERSFLLSQITAELKYNLDILSLIDLKGLKSSSLTKVKLINQLKTTTYDSMLLAGLPLEVAFKGHSRKNVELINEEEIAQDSSDPAKGKSQIETYEFVIRKINVLKAIAEAGDEGIAAVKLSQRVSRIRLHILSLLKRVV